MSSSLVGIPLRLSRPIADGLVPRPRLFTLLDRFRARPISWIEAPPGAGKTSLVSSWIDARGLKALWYSVEPGDRDPADFFHHLRSSDFDGVAGLPALTPEYRGDLGGFSRRFFAALIESRRDINAVVVDDFQEAPSDSPLATLLVAAAEVLAPAVGLIVLSRTPPPVGLKKAIAHADVARLDADDLRLTLGETGALAGASERANANALFQLTQGWAAGVRLLLDRVADGGSPIGTSPLPEAIALATPAVFDLLALEVFERSPRDQCELWLSTAWFTRFTAPMAAAASGNAGAGELLESLAMRRYFIDRREAEVLGYEYHPLFAQFLRAQVRLRSSAAAVRESMLRSASQLTEAGEIDAALTLTIEAGDAKAAAPLILERAAHLFAQGRTQTLCTALESLPHSQLEENPWLLYWLGVARAATDPQAGRECVQLAYRRFTIAGDPTGQALSIAAMLDSLWAEWNHLARFSPWIEAARQVVDLEPGFPNPSSELRFYSSLIGGLANIRPGDPLARVAAARAQTLLQSDAGVNEKVVAASNLIQYLSIVGEHAICVSVRLKIAPLLDRADLLPISRLAALHAQAFVANALCEPGDGLAAMLQAQALVDKHGFGFARDITRLFMAWMQLEDGRPDAAMKVLAEVDPGVGLMRPNETAIFHFLSAWLALLNADGGAALTNARLAVETIDSSETVGPAVCCHAIHSIALARCDRVDESLAAARRTRRWVAQLRGGALRMLSYLVEADALFEMRRDDEARAALATAMATGRLSGSHCTGVFIPEWLAKLCARALQLGIEPDYTAQLVTARGLRSPSRDIEAWPWPIRLSTLGQFSLIVNGRDPMRGRKAQRRVLDLLSAIVGFGGEEVHRDSVAAALWPELDGGAARDAFEIALHRLRKLLGRDDAVLLLHGKLNLNPELTWTDVGAFERLAVADPSLDIDSVRRALALYKGPFLASYEDSAWLFPARERIRARYVRLVTVTGQWFEEAGNQRDAILVYGKALEFEPLAEALYRSLIGCLAREGRRAEALEVYRRCRQMLSVVLSLAPSPETEALRHSIEYPA